MLHFVQNDDMSPAWQPEIPYADLPGLPPTTELESKAVLKQCVEARARLSEMAGGASHLPDPDLLVRTLPLLEAQASSAIENVVTTADALFREVSLESSLDPATKEARRYARALLAAFAELSERPVSTGMAERIASTLLDRPIGVRRVPGTALARSGSGSVIYTPPDGETLLRDLLANWEAFVHGSDDLDPLVRMAVAHYQFEAIHPFVDGNGRTSRILNNLLLVERGLLEQPILYLSRYILAHRQAYYELLLGVTRDGAFEPWISFVLRGVTETASWTTAKLDAIRHMQEETEDFLRARARTICSTEFVQLLFRRPYCRIADLVEASGMGRQAASRHMAKAVELGLLREERHGRDKLFVHDRFLHLLTAEDLVKPLDFPR